jgi:hypothetical protein
MMERATAGCTDAPPAVLGEVLQAAIMQHSQQHNQRQLTQRQ